MANEGESTCKHGETWSRCKDCEAESEDTRGTNREDKP